MIDLQHLPPAILLFLSAIPVPFLKGRLKSAYLLLPPLLAFYLIWNLQPGSAVQIEFLGHNLTLLRVDRLAKIFGYIFTLNAFAVFIYAFKTKHDTRSVSALCYVGGALGVVFAGDLVSLYIFWEIMAVTSTFLILARKSKKSLPAANRYILVHIFGGLVLLAGVVFVISETGSTNFDPSLFEIGSIGSWLVLSGLLINAAAPPFASWLPDAYPEATISGGVILSAYTSKTAVYTLIRGFPGWEILIIIGCAMTIYGIIYALLENDMRRILAYSIVNQVGFMIAGVGIGTKMAINGAAAHAFCHIIYKALLWMSAGAVLERTGKSKCTDLGGLYKSMPFTLGLAVIGAMAISAVPGTSGFTSKSLIIAGAAEAHWFWPWLVLEIASAGVFLHAGIKFPYFVFFAKDRGLRTERAGKSMVTAMCFLAFLCIFLGVFPQPLYRILPYQEVLGDGFTVYSAESLVTQSQLLVFSGLVFFLFLAWLKRTDTISLDTDWFYRKGGRRFYRLADWALNGLNQWSYHFFVERLTRKVVHFFKAGPERFFVIIQAPFWRTETDFERFQRIRRHYRRGVLGAAPIGLTAFVAVLLLFLLSLF